MYVVKRDGHKEPVMFDKITDRIKKLCYGLNDLVDSVKVAMRKDINGKSLSGYATLKPGQQATVLEKIKISNVDTAEAVAWKNGELMFSSQDIRSVMRQISRWYDVEIVYEDHLKPMTFSGSISKYSNVSEVLKMLELTGNIHFQITGRRIIVMN